jgi:hypothetical protein
MIGQLTHWTSKPDERPVRAYDLCRYTLSRQGRHVQYAKTPVEEPNAGDDPKRSAFIDSVLARRAAAKAKEEEG